MTSLDVSMTDRPYHLFAGVMQAYRRKVEAINLAIGGALGIAADPYPHQIATVRRILTDTRVRHLIADEVGLGKTVQALMILNALRWQYPRHRAVILVPDRLVRQWQNECWTRCHCQAAVIGAETEDVQDDAGVRIVRPQSLQSASFRLDAGAFDLLIVDEPQTMPVSVMAMVEQIAPQFRQLLVLSATPGLGDPQRRRQIMRLLEPERMLAGELSGSDDPLAEAESVGSSLQSAEMSPSQTAAIFRTFSTERRIARARRADWGRYLPGRRYSRTSVEPLQTEAERVRIGMQLLNQEGEATRSRTDMLRNAQALHRSRQSARRVIDAASRRSDTAGMIVAAAEAIARSPGDSRVDALLDILTEIWAGDPERQVVIIAGDNPTIDHIQRGLRRYFGTDVEPLPVASLRRTSEAQEDEAGDVREMFLQLEDFSRGKARVLLIGEWVQAGLNLHHYARDIIFYSTPWSPDAVDQLIGRLDRLRPSSLRRGDRGEPLGRVRIWSVTQTGAPESSVVDGLEALSVFRRPLPPVPPDQSEEMLSALEDLALGRRTIEALERLGGYAAQWDGERTTSALMRLNPYSAQAAQREYESLNRSALPEPILKQPTNSDSAYVARAEEALRGWLDHMTRARFLYVAPRVDAQEPEVRFQTIWHADPSRAADFQLPEFAGRNWMDGHVPFLYRRRHLTTPPRNAVVTDAGEPGGRLLRFLDHGDSLHEGLVRAFVQMASGQLQNIKDVCSCVVLLPDGHPALEFAGRDLLVMTAWADPGILALPAFPTEALRDMAQAAPTEAQKATLGADVQLAEDWWRSDQRWLRTMLPALLLCEVGSFKDGAWERIEGPGRWDVLKPLYYGDEATVCGAERKWRPEISRTILAKGIAEQMSLLVRETTGSWGERLAKLQDELSGRMLQVRAESEDLVRLRRLELERREREMSGALDQLRRGLVAAAERRLAMAQKMADARAAWLSAIPEKARTAKPQGIGFVCLRIANDYSA